MSLVACQSHDKTIEKSKISLQQASLKSGVDTNNIIHTYEDKDFAFSLYKNEKEFGIIHFSPENDGWRYIGGSSSSYQLEQEVEPFNFIVSTWSKGMNSRKYATVLFGEINNNEIDRITVLTADNKKLDATILQNHSFWYVMKKNH